MREAKNFTFDGISSEDMGVYITQVGGGIFDEIFLPQRVIIETRIGKRDKPYFQRVETLPLSFSLTIFIEQWKERDNMRQLAKWLYKDHYKPLVFDTNPDRIFYAIVEGTSTLVHNGRKEGFITLNFRCNSPYTYSNPILHEDIESFDGQFSVLNSGDMTIKPKVWITKTVSVGGISISIEETEQMMSLNNLQLGEEVFIDCEHFDIISSLDSLNVYRYDDHNDVWLELIEGNNSLVLNGDFTLSIEYQQVYLAD